MPSLFAKVFGTKNDREIKRLYKIVALVNEREPDIKPLSDEALRAKTVEFRERLAAGAALDDLLPEAFAVVREASIRVLGMRHFDVQVLGGLALHEGCITEMRTGEGKTLTATMPVYLNALTGRGVHVVTVNDYLARRDSEWMGSVYRFLGLTVGVIVHGIKDSERREAYAADITYGQNNEFGFDYLRDNMKLDRSNFVQRDFYYAIVDEVDSILIDEARTPLIISGPTEDSTDQYYVIDRIIPGLRKEEHFTIDEKARSVMLTEEGVERVQKALNIDNLYAPEQIEILHHVNQALRAHTLYQRDREYIVTEGEVVIVDEFTGRLMPGRRWSDGLHQAVEAKEKVKIESENQTLATVTFQNFFRMYEKLSGMTGTADTEAVEFKKIYNLDVLVVPTHQPMIRLDNPDTIYRSAKEKFKAVVERIAECHEKGQPALVGTISIEKNEMMSVLLKKRGVPHEILNAKNHAREAEIIAQAGRKGQVTLATNMAGRGTDIVLGGNPEMLAKARWPIDFPERELDTSSDDYKTLFNRYKVECDREREAVLAAGGLMVMGTERHESRRIDNQLRGRSGRQGDPGESIFYLALDDDLMRIFGSERMDSMLGKLGVKEDEPIFHNWITKAIANAQEKVEGHNFDIRKRLLEYDDVMNKQREVVYGERKRVLEGDALRDDYMEIVDEVAQGVIDQHCDEKTYPENWPWNELAELIKARWGVEPFESYMAKEDSRVEATREALLEDLKTALVRQYERREQTIGEKIMRDAERFFMLTTIDQQWKEHLFNMDHLRDGIGLRGYAQENPLLAYKRESFGMFTEMLDRIREQALDRVMTFVPLENPEEQFRRRRAVNRPTGYGREDLRRAQRPEASPQAAKPMPVQRTSPKVGPNDPCPCGSGKKYKKCCRDKDKAAAGA